MGDLEFMKPCPFCSCGDITVHAKYNRKIRKRFAYAQCDMCRSTGRSYCISAEYAQDDDSIWDDVAVQDAIRAWNRRAY